MRMTSDMYTWLVEIILNLKRKIETEHTSNNRKTP